jgi:uncharacterized repeat protein (TIGR01451 family)
MIDRLLKWKGPRGFALVAIVTGIAVAAGLLAATALALVQDNANVSVEVTDKDHSSGLVSLGSASVEYIGSSASNQASGTGLFDPFVRLQGSPTEKGYNTDGPVQFDTKTGTWTHAIKASAIPVVDCDGSGPGTTQCWELFNDINDSNSAPYISLTRVEIWFTTNPNLVGYDAASHSFPAASGATKQYEFTGEIKIHDVNQGSGRGDLRYLVPIISFTSADYFVLYSEWGSADAAPDGNTYGSDGGFEEWKVRKTPNVGIVKTANPVGPVNAGGTIGFDVTVSNTGVADATNVTISDPLPAGAGSDLNWSLNPAFSGCSITGAVGSQTLNCAFATLAAGASIGPIHIQSATTAADCAVVTNTATVASENDGGGSSTASVTVQCAAIRILKQSTKGTFPLVTDAGNGALFTVTPPVGSAFTVRDNNDPSAGGKSDESSTFGEVCISGLAPGSYTVAETTPPSGYGAGTTIQGTAVAAVGTSCTAPNKPTDANSAIFRNPPLGEIGVTFKDLGSGETKSSIVCKKGAATVDAVSENGATDPAFDDTNEAFTNLAPGTYDCQVVIDP